MPKNKHPEVFCVFWCMGEDVDRPDATWRPLICRRTRRSPQRIALVHGPGAGDTWQPRIRGFTRCGPLRRPGWPCTGAGHVRPVSGWLTCAQYMQRVSRRGRWGQVGAGDGRMQGVTWRPAIGRHHLPHPPGQDTRRIPSCPAHVVRCSGHMSGAGRSGRWLRTGSGGGIRAL